MIAWLFYRVVAWVNQRDPELAYFLLTGDPSGLPGWEEFQKALDKRRETR